MDKTTDDERKALVKAILSVRWANGDPLSGVTSRTAQMIAEPILAAGYRRQGPITDAELEAATFSVMDWGLPDVPPKLCEDIARAALEAALAADRSE